MSKFRIKQLMAESGATTDDVARAMWPDSTDHSRYVAMKTFEKNNYRKAALDQVKALAELFGVNEIDKLIEP
jgi:hypothetical protein